LNFVKRFDFPPSPGGYPTFFSQPGLASECGLAFSFYHSPSGSLLHSLVYSYFATDFIVIIGVLICGAAI
jgi:hypothetical protein